MFMLTLNILLLEQMLGLNESQFNKHIAAAITYEFQMIEINIVLF